ncbi:MAG TPA: hypothetical protein VMA32_12100 [Streptosporangiaceae bacterium]|nr:hypothetical protein [Streptosporangiaceae bacterium]
MAVAAQLVLAPVALLIAAILTLTGRISRWRPAWLLLPAVAGACWLAAVTVPVSAAAVDAGSRRLIRAELHAALHPALLLHPALPAGAGWWLPRELPLALLAGTAEATIMLWLCWRRSRPRWRPGAIAVVRRRAAAAAVAAARTVTASGCAIGVHPSSGRLTGFSWADAQRGVLLAGPSSEQLGQLGQAAAAAAMRLRKTVIVVEEPDHSGGRAGQIATLARRLGMPVAELSAPDGQTADAMGRAIRSRRVLVVAACQPELACAAARDLSGVLARLRDLGLRGDCLAWVSSCDRVDPEIIGSLLELGPATGTSVLLSTTSMTCAASLAERVGMTIACTMSAERSGAVSAERWRTVSAEGRLVVPIALGPAR